MQGLEKFLNAASADPGTVQHYEFMQVGRLFDVVVFLFCFH